MSQLTLGPREHTVHSATVPPPCPPLICQRGMGLQSRGTTGRGIHRAPPGTAFGVSLPPQGTGLAPQFWLPTRRVPTARPSGSLGRAAQSCAPLPVDLRTAGGALSPPAQKPIPPFPGSRGHCLCCSASCSIRSRIVLLLHCFTTVSCPMISGHLSRVGLVCSHLGSHHRRGRTAAQPRPLSGGRPEDMEAGLSAQAPLASVPAVHHLPAVGSLPAHAAPAGCPAVSGRGSC